MDRKKNRAFLVFVFLLLLMNIAFPSDLGFMNEVFLPLESFKNRANYEELKPRMLDGFGAYRTAGHKHAGLDIKGGFTEPVYSIGIGVVKAIYGEFPYATVLIEHHLQNNEIIYSGYIHIEDIEVRVNQIVNQNTRLGRLFSEKEFKEADFYENHLHFEVRKTIERYRGISIKCVSIEELNKYFYDPVIFMKEQMRGSR